MQFEASAPTVPKLGLVKLALDTTPSPAASPPASLLVFSIVACVFAASPTWTLGNPHVTKASQLALGIFMLGASTLRADPAKVKKLLMPIVPPPLPAAFCVYASGLAEFIAGLLLLGGMYGGNSDHVKLGGNLTVAILVAVAPANLYHAFSETAQNRTGITGQTGLYLRLMMQAVFLKWAVNHADFSAFM